MKKLGVILMAAVMCLELCACGGTETTTAAATQAATTAATTAAAKTTAAATQAATTAAAESSAVEALFEGPTLICSAGQSADVDMVKVMFDKKGLSYTRVAVASKADFGDCKTLLVAIGGSSKGLGAAGIDADEELERVKVLLADAQAAGLKIVAAHIGGSGRRGKLGDRYIEPVVAVADYLVLVSGGNEDGLFTQLCETYDVPSTVVDDMTACIDVFGSLFKN